MLRRCGVPRGWKLGLVGVAVVLAVEPIRTTLGYGQVNTLLMALVVADLLPDAPGERRRIPQGTLIGLAAAIKLTPALFVVFAFLIGKRRAALTAMISFVVFTGLGAVLLFGETVAFFGGLSGGDTRTASPLYTGNQSLLGVFFRLGDSSRVTTLIGLAIAGRGRAARRPGRRPLVAAGAEGVRGRPGRADHLPGLAAVLDPPLRLDPADRGGRCSARDCRAGCATLGGFWVVWVCVCLPLAVLPYGGGPGARSTTCCSSWWPTSDRCSGCCWSPGWPGSWWSAPGSLRRAADRLAGIRDGRPLTPRTAPSTAACG